MDTIRETAVDINGAIAGEAEPNPDMNTIDALGERAGIADLAENGELRIKEDLEERDRDRPSQENSN
ncbi:MAG: hypothetical protein AAFX40_08450 [Cyanobacteria bacterium J06639_1]